jgi:hypothetical protein
MTKKLNIKSVRNKLLQFSFPILSLSQEESLYHSMGLDTMRQHQVTFKTISLHIPRQHQSLHPEPCIEATEANNQTTNEDDALEDPLNLDHVLLIIMTTLLISMIFLTFLKALANFEENYGEFSA